MNYYEMKVVGYERVAAKSVDEASDSFERLMKSGYTVSSLRWKSVAVFEDDDGETSREEENRLVAQMLADIGRLKCLLGEATAALREAGACEAIDIRKDYWELLGRIYQEVGCPAED